MSLEKKVIKKQRKKQRKKRRKEKSTTYSLGIIQTPPKILAPLSPANQKPCCVVKRVAYPKIAHACAWLLKKAGFVIRSYTHKEEKNPPSDPLALFFFLT
jgi:hypothetical protein